MKQSVPGESDGTSLAALQAERDRFRVLAEEREETIRDLRGRLDRESEERRRLTALLAGWRAPWWRRWFR